MKRCIIVYIVILIIQSFAPQIHSPLIPAARKASTDMLASQNNLFNNTKYLLFMDDNNKITNEAGFVLRSLEIGYGKKYPHIIADFKEYVKGLEASRKGLNKYNLFIHQKQKICPSPSSFNKSEIYRYITFTEQKQDLVIKKIQQTSDLHNLLQNTQKMKQLTDKYLSYVKLTLQGAFCNSNKANETKGNFTKKTEKQYYKNNLEVSNWYYGQTNQLIYKAYLIKKAANFNLTTCPSELPFVRDDQQKCFNCPPGTIYNLGALKCDSCRPGKMLNVAKGTCEPCYGEMFIINHQFVCKACAIQSGQLYDPKLGKCYKCKLNQYLDSVNRICKLIKCPPEKPKFNRQLEICQTCAFDEKISLQDPSKCLEICTPDKPLYNALKGICSQCQKGQLYNHQAKTCKKQAMSQTTQNGDSENSHQNTESQKGTLISNLILATNNHHHSNGSLVVPAIGQKAQIALLNKPNSINK